MRILFDSQEPVFKTPFGTLSQGQSCQLHIHIPSSVGAQEATCILEADDGTASCTAMLTKERTQGDYDIFGGSFSLTTPGLYFYYFRIQKPDSSFRLFKQGRDTNMEAGDRWQVTCTPRDFVTPDWAKGAIIYQIFPDRFCKAGSPDLTGKLEPYTVHKNWDEDVEWRPDEQGRVLNNDFFGGNFRGIAEKMEYIASFGTTVLYLNPISKSFSSHRYDTGDYKVPDPMLGTLDDFSHLCETAHRYGIKVVLDGVYSHTGSNSIYFQSACASVKSPYYDWYTFYRYPDYYNSWWGFDTLPTVNKMAPAFLDYIIHSEDSVVAHWLRLGADGFRLDVVDELPDAFVLRLKNRIRQLKPDALLIGEVWEDASNKIAYDIRRRYFADGELDSCMNYPFRFAILDFLKGNDPGEFFRERIMSIAENYPPQVLACNMNMLGTHDTPRILTALVDDGEYSREEAAVRKLSSAQREQAVQLLKIASFLQFVLPGAPSIYYGDEVGMEGHKDPFNRRTYPWGREDIQLLDHYKALGALRKEQEILQKGDIRFFCAEGRKLGFTRTYHGKQLKIYLNYSSSPWEIPVSTPVFARGLTDSLAPMGYCVLED